MPLTFIKGALKHPLKTGAVLPSSIDLGMEMIRYWPYGAGQTIVEYGPGTGSFSRLIHERLADERYIALELNPIFVEQIKKYFPLAEVYHRSAEELPQILKDKGLRQANLIISGLPWSIIHEDQQVKILRTTRQCLDKEGVFSTFAYLHALKLPRARHFSNLIKEVFPHVKTSKVVWRNLPPAIIYHCSKRRVF